MIARVAALSILFAVPAMAQVAPKDGDLPQQPGAEIAGAAPCPLIVEPVRFCGTSPNFVLTPQSENSEITSYYETPEGIQAVAVVEPLGRNDGLTVAAMQQAALENLSQASGVPVSSLPVIERGSNLIAGVSQPNFVYRGTVEGVAYVYSNSMVLMDNAVAQFVTIEVGVTTYSPRHSSVHLRFLEQVQVAQ